jgi:uncharacterized membrane protein YhfC
MTADIQIESFSVTCLLVTAAICLVAVLVAWYTVRDRIKLSQVILGVFSYVLVMMLGNIFDLAALNAGIPQTGLAYGLYVAVSVVVARELIRFAAMKYGIQANFHDTDSSIGFALGFGGMYLMACAAYYFNCYTTASEFVKSGLDSFMVNVGDDSEEALSLLQMIAQQEPMQFVSTGVNRVFYLIREIALSVLLWYALNDEKRKYNYALVLGLHVLAMLPDGLYQAELLQSSYAMDGATCVISAGIAFLAARQYNASEDQVAHFQVEKLRTRQRK